MDRRVVVALRAIVPNSAKGPKPQINCLFTVLGKIRTLADPKNGSQFFFAGNLKNSHVCCRFGVSGCVLGVNCKRRILLDGGNFHV